MKNFLLLLFVFTFHAAVAQDDLEKLLNEETQNEEKAKIDYTTATFKTTRIINTQSSEIPGKGVLQFTISHRFGRVNSGWREFFGLDNANIRINVEYGINNWLAVGIGRSRNEKMFDGFVKAKVLRQSKGRVNMPITLDWVSSVGATTLPALPGRADEMTFVRRLNFMHQIIVARKFHEYFSMQIVPTWIHRNLVPRAVDDNDVFAVGAGAAVKLSRSVRLTGEYHYVLSKQTANDFYNPVSIGIDLETGGHVFQFMLTNSIDMIDNLVIPKTTGSWRRGDIHIGFNVNRVFTVVDYAKRAEKKIQKAGVK
jgi:opacity protein-like surface antigen